MLKWRTHVQAKHHAHLCNFHPDCLVTNMSKLTFSGHESFTCRQFWLKKGYDFLEQGHRFSDADAVVYLGVGKNMVNSIQYWMKSFNLVDETSTLRSLASYLLADEGKDPYLEQPGSLWLLHYLLVTSGRASLYDIVFNGFRREYINFTKPQLVNFAFKYSGDMGVSVSVESIQRDVDVLVRNYARPPRKPKSPEDDHTTLLMDLDLLNTFELARNDGGVRYAIERRARINIPMHVVLYAILNQYQGLSVSFRNLANDRNGPGLVFALDEDGLLSQINQMTALYPSIIYTDDAGIRELQFRTRLNPEQVLDDYYNT